MESDANQNASLKTYYDGYFATDAQLDWYRLCAIDKAQHIIDRSASVAPKTILDVGCGDGAVLLQLDHAGFGDQLSAADISTSGLEVLKKKPFKRLAEQRRGATLNTTLVGRRMPSSVGRHRCGYFSAS